MAPVTHPHHAAATAGAIPEPRPLTSRMEVFQRRNRRAPNHPTATITTRGCITLTQAAHTAMGSPDAVELLYDRAEAAERVAKRLTDPDRVVRSKLFPFQFYAAYRAVRSLRWSYTLEKALQASLAKIPALPGRTLVLVDQSPSMFPGYPFSSRQQHKEISNADLSKLFGSAIALRAADATLVGYGQRNYPVGFRHGEALLKLIEKFRMDDGTDTFGAIADHFDGHDRIVVVTDEQNNGRRYSSIDQVVPRHVPVYTWNIGGNPVGATTSGLGTRHTFGGLNDAAFRSVGLIEQGRDARWPWLETGDDRG